jgi:hypothetical protein
MSDEVIEGIAAAEPAKRGMSDEHKAKMAAGRAAARSRGRPAARAETAPLPRAAPDGMTEDQRILAELERHIAAVDAGEVQVNRDAVGGLLSNSFDIPLQGRRPGWDYEYKTIKINGEEVDPSDLIEYRNGGWIPVPRTDMPGQVPADWKGPYIDRRGMRMMMRPMRLTEQAKAEALAHAFQVRQEKLEGAMAGDGGRDQAPRRLPDGRPAALIKTDEMVQVLPGHQPLI